MLFISGRLSSPLNAEWKVFLPLCMRLPTFLCLKMLKPESVVVVVIGRLFYAQLRRKVPRLRWNGLKRWLSVTTVLSGVHFDATFPVYATTLGRMLNCPTVNTLLTWLNDATALLVITRMLHLL